MKRYFTVLFGILFVCCSSNRNAAAQNVKGETIVTYAKSYNPNSLKKETLPNPSKEVVNSIKSNTKNLEESLTLILLKLYKSHLYCCNQSYELRSSEGRMEVENPILKNYLLITKQYDIDKPIEFISSAISYDWVTKNKRLLDYADIKSVYLEIKEKRKQIESGNF